jgi:hypothetical protein
MTEENSGPASDDAMASPDAGATEVDTLPALPDGGSKQGHDIDPLLLEPDGGHKQGHDIHTGPAGDDVAPA